jgi:hypothetical protein
MKRTHIHSQEPSAGNPCFALSRRTLLKALPVLAGAAVPGGMASVFAGETASSSLTRKPAIVVRTTENIPEGSWVWLLDAARDAGVGRIYLLMKQDENQFESERTERTWSSGELLVPVEGRAAAPGWENSAWLDEMLPRARAYGIEMHAWWPCFQDALAAAKMPYSARPGDKHDIFVDPAFPDVGANVAIQLHALLDRYPFDGIALDWLRYNERAGGSTGPLARKFAVLSGRPWSQEALMDPQMRALWDDLRASTIADWVANLLAGLRPRHPNVAWSAFVLPWMFKEVAQSYRHLSKAGLDSLQPMIYWRDWAEDVSFTSDVISPAPFYLSGRTTLDPAFDITCDEAELKTALDYLPVDRLGCVTWYHHTEWREESFAKLAAVTEDMNRARANLYGEATPALTPVPAGKRLAPARFAPDAAVWAVTCLGELHKRGAMKGLEPVIPVLAFHRFSEGALGSSASDWHTSTAYLEALFASLKSFAFDVIPVSQAAAYMTSEDRKLMPGRPLAITIDDGSATVASLFEPRAAKAGFSYSAALVTNWVSDGQAQTIDTGDGVSDRILTWKEVKALAATGRVSIISHSQEQHRYAATGPAGLETGPAITSRLWIAAENRQETETERLLRVYHDLAASRENIERHTGTAPTVMVWPYGLYDDLAEAAAKEAGFTHFMQFVGNSFAAPRKNPERIMRVSVMAADEAVPLTFPQDTVTAQGWWLAFQKWARATQSVDLIEASLAQLGTGFDDHPEVRVSRAAVQVLNGHSALAARQMRALRAAYLHDAEIHAAIDEFETEYKALA